MYIPACTACSGTKTSRIHALHLCTYKHGHKCTYDSLSFSPTTTNERNKNDEEQNSMKPANVWVSTASVCRVLQPGGGRQGDGRTKERREASEERERHRHKQARACCKIQCCALIREERMYSEQPVVAEWIRVHHRPRTCPAVTEEPPAQHQPQPLAWRPMACSCSRWEPRRTMRSCASCSTPGMSPICCPTCKVNTNIQ